MIIAGKSPITGPGFGAGGGGGTCYKKISECLSTHFICIQAFSK